MDFPQLPKPIRDWKLNLEHPESGHDRGRRPYFEGWYVKLVSADRSRRLAIIPGLFRGDDNKVEAFVQVLDGAAGRSWYVAYPESEYWAGRGEFVVQVGPNRFTSSGIELDIPAGIDHPAVSGKVSYESAFQPWPVTVRAPGAMGWYAYVPTLECYHGVVSFGHTLNGELTLDGSPSDFSGGRGYIEQDWGQAFPAGYVWMHTNHFNDPSISLMASVAMIPWRRGRFPGLLVGLKTRDQFYRFATYTGAKTQVLQVTDHHVELTVRSRDGMTCTMTADRPDGALLHAPIRSEMHKRVEETLKATVALRLTDQSGGVLLEDVGSVAGLEVHGEIEPLLHPKL